MRTRSRSVSRATRVCGVAEARFWLAELGSLVCYRTLGLFFGCPPYLRAAWQLHLRVGQSDRCDGRRVTQQVLAEASSPGPGRGDAPTEYERSLRPFGCSLARPGTSRAPPSRRHRGEVRGPWAAVCRTRERETRTRDVSIYAQERWSYVRPGARRPRVRRPSVRRRPAGLAVPNSDDICAKLPRHRADAVRRTTPRRRRTGHRSWSTMFRSSQRSRHRADAVIETASRRLSRDEERVDLRVDVLDGNLEAVEAARLGPLDLCVNQPVRRVREVSSRRSLIARASCPSPRARRP